MWTPTIQFSIKTKKIRKIKIKTKSGDHWLYKHGAQWILEGCGLGTSGEGIGLFGLVPWYLFNSLEGFVSHQSLHSYFQVA